MDSKKILKYWEETGKKGKTTMPDFNFKEVEIEAISKTIEAYVKYINKNPIVADVGCGKGESTEVFSQIVGEGNICGMDYSTEMIKQAKNNYPKIQFYTSDITTFNFSKMFDIVITERCLINLPNWKEKQKALMHIYNMLKPNGIFIMMECSKQGLDKLNQLRLLFGLKEDKVVEFNEFFDEIQFANFITKYFDIISIKRFGIYNLISKVVHPALVSPKEPEYKHRINKIAASLYGEVPEIDVGQNIMYVLRVKK